MTLSKLISCNSTHFQGSFPAIQHTFKAHFLFPNSTHFVHWWDYLFSVVISPPDVSFQPALPSATCLSLLVVLDILQSRGEGNGSYGVSAVFGAAGDGRCQLLPLHLRLPDLSFLLAPDPHRRERPLPCLQKGRLP